MGKMTYADEDRVSYRTTQRRRERDIEFLATIRTATTDELLKMLVDHIHGPAWKVIAIRRAIDRAEREGRTK